MEKINIEPIKNMSDIDSLIQLKEDINSSIDKRIEELNLLNEANKLSEKPFGYLKECFETMAPDLFKFNDGKKIINKYSKTIKENKNLKQLHTVYESVRNISKDSDLNFFFDKFTSQDWNIANTTLKEDVKKLGMIVAEAFLTLNKPVLPEENPSLDYAIEYVIENKVSGKNLPKYSAALKIVKEHVNKNEISLKESLGKKENIDDKIINMVNEFNEKFNDLEDDEKAIINEIVNSSTPENVFQQYKDNCKAKISEKRNYFEKENDTDSVKRIDTIIEQISKKEYSKDTLIEDICNMIEISNIFE